jgi:hypothetical protein
MQDLNPIQLAAVILTLVGVMVAFLVGTAVIDGVASASETPGEVEDRFASPLVDTGSAASFEDTSYFSGEVTQLYRVNDSTGKAIELRGASDSKYQTSKSVTLPSDNTWTVSVHAAFNDSYGTSNGTVYSVNGRLMLQYDNSSQQWVGWYYDEDTRYSHRINVSASNQPDTLQNVQLVGNGSHVAIYRNNTRGEVADLSVEKHEDALDTSNWAGRQDELRGYDAALNQSQRQRLIDSPVQPLDSVTPDWRVYFDTTSDGSEPVYFTDSTLSLSNTSVAAGLPGNVLSGGSDYSVDLDSGSITALAGGLLDGAPTAFVHYEFTPNTAVSDLTTDIGGSMQLFAVVPIVMIAGLLFVTLNKFRE